MIPQSQPHVILLTRPLAQSQRFAGMIAAGLSAKVVISPAMEIRGLAAAAPEGPFSDLIFTSQHAVEHARRLGFTWALHAYCVGEKTAAVARAAGYPATALGGDAEGLVAALVALNPKGRLLHLHGVNTRGDVAARLTSAGIPALGLAVYDQRALPLTPEAVQLLGSKEPVIMPLFSPRTAQIILAQAPFAAPLSVVAISSVVAEIARTLTPDRLEIAQSPDVAGMLAALGGFCGNPALEPRGPDA